MARARQTYLGVFENMDFEPYKFREYPKVVGYKDEKKTDPILVADAKEEVQFITTGSPGAFVTREEELNLQLEKQKVELELAKAELAEIKAKQELAQAATKAPEKKV